jgi:chloramphenicol O-acetyltransferase type A
MRYINIETWSRREHFKVYNAFDHPHFGMCANVDLTSFYPHVKELDRSITTAIVYAISRAANAISEFRYRIRAGDVVEHDVVHPSTTILTDDDLFSYCTFDYVEPFSDFAARAAETIATVREHPTLEDEPGRDDLLFMTAIPWVSFTSFLHPLPSHPPDSIPRFAWGKFFGDGGRRKMPLAVQAHHALMDGIHVGKFYAEVQDTLDHPDAVLGEP